jgi:hypothetical protein
MIKQAGIAKYTCFMCERHHANSAKVRRHLKALHKFTTLQARPVDINRRNDCNNHHEAKYDIFYDESKAPVGAVKLNACPSCWFVCPTEESEPVTLYKHTLDKHFEGPS